MDPSSWSAYSQHFSRLGASMNAPPGPLSQSAQLNDLALSSSLSRQDHISGYANTPGSHHFLLATSHGLNPSQTASRGDPSFSTSGLFAANYDASLLSASFQSPNKGHISTFPQGGGLFKAVNRENDFTDLRAGFSHCGVAAYARNSDNNNGISGGSALSSGSIFPNSMTSGSWRHSGMMPSTCGPFGVLPHETVLQRSHLVGRGSEKIGVQVSKPSRSSLAASSFVEQDLSRGYRSILSSPARPPSSFMDPNNASHTSLLSPQNDPYFSSVTDSYYSSCSKPDFGSYNSCCSNVQPGVQRSAISPYCYSQSFGAFDATIEKQDLSSAPNTAGSANSNFSNFVPNRNHLHLQNGQISRQTVITSNTSNNNSSVIYNTQSHQTHANHSYGQRDIYSYTSGPPHSVSNVPQHHSGNSNNSSNSSSGSRQAFTHLNSNQHSSIGQSLYPPMSTPIPASTPAHPTPPASIGQAYIPAPLVMNHDRSCSSVNSQPTVYNSPSSDACYSTTGTCPSESGSPVKHEMSQHSSPSVYSVDSSNLSMNGTPFVDPSRMQSHQSSEANYVANMVHDAMSAAMHDHSTNDSTSKLLDENLPVVDSDLISPDCTDQKEMHISSVLPVNAVKVNKSNSFGNIQMSSVFSTNGVDLHLSNINSHDHHERNDSFSSQRPHCSSGSKCDVFPYSSNSSPSHPPPIIDYTHKIKAKSKHNRKRKDVCHNAEDDDDALPLNCSYSAQHHPSSSLSPPNISAENEKDKIFHHDHLVDHMRPPSRDKLSSLRDTSSLPVDLSHVSLNLTVKKQEVSITDAEDVDGRTTVPGLNYEPSVVSSSDWSLPACESNVEKVKVQNICRNDDEVQPSDSKSENCDQSICETSAVDDLCDEAKNKLCNTIEDDLGFLAELSSASDADDGISKGSLSEKKVNKEQGFLQSFLTFLEVSEEASTAPPPACQKLKEEKEMVTKEVGNSELAVLSSEEQSASENEWLLSKEGGESSDENKVKSHDHKKSELQDQDDKDNFDETPSLDPTLFGCSTLQKEMVVPNPEAPSFSSDEDENSSQGIFDSVAMAIKRLCEENEDEVHEKAKIQDEQESTADVLSVSKTLSSNEEKPGNGSQNSEKPSERSDCKEKSAISLTPKRSKRKKRRNLRSRVSRVNKVQKRQVSLPKKQISKITVISKGPEINRSNCMRRPLMRKCKALVLKNSRRNKRKRKQRIPVKRKYVRDDDQGNKEEKVKAVEMNEPIHMEKEELTAKIPLPAIVPEVFPRKLRRTSRKRQKKKQHDHHAPHKKSTRSSLGQSIECVENEIEKQAIHIPEEDGGGGKGEMRLLLCDEKSDVTKQLKSVNHSENIWSVETHFKTGDYVVSMESKNCDQPPPIWRIEGKNVLQLFEAFEADNKFLYRNTSSYSRWSPSSRHKYSKLAVEVIKSDDDTVIVEMCKKPSGDEKQIKGPSRIEECTVHPQRENFEVYLQTLVSHALDPDFIPEIIKENDEYFLSHLQAIEKFTSEKKQVLLSHNSWTGNIQESAEMLPCVSVSVNNEDEKSLCEVCNCNKTQYTVHFHGQLYDPSTLENKTEVLDHHPSQKQQFPLCGTCVQTVTLYSRLHHHKYHFFQQGCKKVKDVRKGEEKESHAILEECLQDTEWMTQMFQEMMDMWNACDKLR